MAKHPERNFDCWVDEYQVAALTGLSRSKLQKDRFNGQGIPYSKIGKACRYRVSDVLGFMEQHRIQPQGQGWRRKTKRNIIKE